MLEAVTKFTINTIDFKNKSTKSEAEERAAAERREAKRKARENADKSATDDASKLVPKRLSLSLSFFFLYIYKNLFSKTIVLIVL